MIAEPASNLLAPSEPPPVDCVTFDNPGPVLLLCEHAGRRVPAALNNLGLSDEVLVSHRAWDIGAEDVARGLSAKLRAPLILQRYSRLVIDANRPPGGTGSIPEISDRVEIPGNIGLFASERDARIAQIFAPMEAAIDAAFTPATRACFSIHSFTPRMDGTDRPWHAGFLTRASTATGEFLMDALLRRRPDLLLALNQPYQIEDDTDWFIPRHAEARGLPHCLIEIRNDLIDNPNGAAQWAELLASAIGDFMESLS